MPDILHQIDIEASIDDVHRALSTTDGLRSWWTADSTALDEVGYVNVFRFDDGTVEFRFRVDDTTPDRVRWTCVAGEKVPGEWVETQIDVRLEPREDGTTRVHFAHRNWASTDGAFAMCNTTWGVLMHRLRDHCEGFGAGPYFD